MNNKQLLGRRLKELIKKKGINQEQLAEMIGVEPTAVSNIVTGHNYPLFSTLEKIINVLDISFEDFFKFSQHDSEENLKKRIIKLLEENPGRMRDIYLIAAALTE